MDDYFFCLLWQVIWENQVKIRVTLMNIFFPNDFIKTVGKTADHLTQTEMTLLPLQTGNC